jgi:hypothetical protein
MILHDSDSNDSDGLACLELRTSCRSDLGPSAKKSISLHVLFIGRLDGLTCVELRTSCGSDSGLLQVTELV